MADFDGEGAPVRVNRGARAGWMIGLLVGVVVVFGVLGLVLRDSIADAEAYKVGHEHVHQDEGGGAPPVPPSKAPGAGPSASPGNLAAPPGAKAAMPPGHSADDGHDHSH